MKTSINVTSETLKIFTSAKMKTQAKIGKALSHDEYVILLIDSYGKKST